MRRQVTCVIMGGGRGRRLYPLTKERCKPAVPLAGKYRLIDIPISNCLNSRLTRIHILTQFNTASLHNHIQSAYHFDPFGKRFVEILSAEQTAESDSWYKGTADAVRHNMHHFHHGEDDDFLILSGDQLYRMDFSDILARHQATGAEVTVAGKLTDRNAIGSFGAIKTDKKGRVERFVEKPQDKKLIDQLLVSENKCLASMGIYVFNAKTLKKALEQDGEDFGRDILPALLGKVRFHAWTFDGYWEDIGTIKSYFEATLALTDPLPPFDFFDLQHKIYTLPQYLPDSKIQNSHLDQVLISDGCLVEKAQLKRCVIGARTRIAQGATLEKSIIAGADFYDKKGPIPLGIGKNTHIEHTIVDKNVRIGNNVFLSPKGKPSGWQQGPFHVQDGILIIVKNSTVPPHTQIKP